MSYLTVSFKEGRREFEIKVVLPSVIIRPFINLYSIWRRRSGRPPFGADTFLLSERAREDLGLPETLCQQGRFLLRHPPRF